ncbi:hypothetical protein JCM8097_007660 [Rhodosporidiobolus ruineniae]
MARSHTVSAPARADSTLASSSPSSSSSFSPSSSPSRATGTATGTGTHLFAPAPSTQLSFLRALLPADLTPNAQLLDEHLATKALTHKSGVDKRRAYGRGVGEVESTEGQQGATGHNEKLAFIGRRVLALHLTSHLTSALSSSPALLASTLSIPSLSTLLDTKSLGASVGAVWRLEDALRWREVKDRSGHVTGLWKCRGTAVEAVVGAVYTTQGLTASQALFERLILPHLTFPSTVTAALSSSSSASAPSPSSIIVDDVPRPAVAEQVQA